MSTEYWFAGSTEEFTPPQIVEHAKAAEAAGFDALGVSDHFAPWFPGGQGSQAWVTLTAIGAATSLPLSTGVTPIQHHYHPGVVAQAFAALASLYPGRVTLGVGSGESVNESPLGLDWPSLHEQQERFDAGLEAINRLWAGETVTMDGGWFRLKEAKLWTLPENPPRMIVSAFGPKAAKIAAERGSGLWSLGDPEQAPEIIEAYKAACSDLGKEPGTIVLHTGIAWAKTQDEVQAKTRRWKPTQLSELYTEDISGQADMQQLADRKLTDEEFAHDGFIVSADLDEHIDRIREIRDLGADVVCLQLNGTADPLGTIEQYGNTVLPALRG